MRVPDPSVPFLDLHISQLQVQEELDAVWHRVTRGSAFVGGVEVEQFEQRWASACEVGFGVGVANGTDAIELVLAALGVGRGDEVVVPANTFIATAEAVVAVGATPVFADVDDSTLLLTPGALRAALTPRTAAAVVVHLYGQAADVPALLEVAGVAGIAVVEDCAQAHGARWQGRSVGSLGAAGCFSFYPGKNLGAFGDGGAVVTSDAALAARVRQLANHGRSPSSRYEHSVIGRNSRLDALQAGVLGVKLDHLEDWNAQRRTVRARYTRNLEGCDEVSQVDQDPRSTSSHHLEVVRVPGRDEVLDELRLAGVEAAVHYPVPCHLQEGFAAHRGDPLPTVERAASELLSLPMYPGITDRQVDRVCEELILALTRNGAASGGPPGLGVRRGAR